MKVLRTMDVADWCFFLGATMAAAGAWWWAGHPGAAGVAAGVLVAIIGIVGGTR